MSIIFLPCHNRLDKFFSIDEEDLHKVIKYNWQYDKNNCPNTSIKNKTIRLSRFLTGKKGIDHIDRNALNNCRSNFRESTTSENTCNHSKYKNNTSGFIGVSLRKSNKTWIWFISKNGRCYKGTCNTAIEAAIERDKMAIKLHGEFAILNFPNK